MKKTLQFLFYSLLASGTITTAYANHLSDVVVATQSAPVEFNVLTSSENLQAVISQAEALYNVEGKGALELNVAIENAKSKLTGSDAEVEKAIKDLKAAILVYNLSNATPDTPFDMTSYITNPSFDNNDGEGWKGIGVINYNEVEFYEKIFDMYQDIEGLPAGKYRMTSQGFERPKPNDSGTAYNNGTEVISAKFYAKATSFPQKNVPFSSLYSFKYTGTGSSNGFINTMEGAKIFFARKATNYLNTVDDILVGEGDVLRIGAKTETKQSGCWSLFDNFKLEFIGFYENSDLIVSLNEYINDSEALLDSKMQTGIKGSLTEAIENSKIIIADQNASYEDLFAAKNKIDEVLNSALLSVESYENLKLALSESEEFLNIFTGTKLANLEKAITNGESKLSDLEASYDNVVEAANNIFVLYRKGTYIPVWMMGDVDNPENNWSMERSIQSKNWILFWEPGYGQDPSVVSDGNYRVNTQNLLDIAENCFSFYSDSLKFITRGRSKTDDSKMIIRLRYTREWEASGSGVDNQIGLLTLTAWSGQSAGHTMAHEVGHCFQYQVHCDNGDQNGWMYGFGANASGGNCWWEMCAQWQGFKIYPSQQFTDGRFANYQNTCHKHLLHETPRYDNYFIQDFWTYKRGMDIIGRLWNESKSPEDPIDTYKKITGLTQEQFNDELYECASRFTTWDIPALQSYGKSKINTRPQPKLNDVGDYKWQIDPTFCPENYGYNVIKLNAPKSADTVSVFFTGRAGATGFRKYNIVRAGWRYGFVAYLNNGETVYSDMGKATRTTADTISFACPDNCKYLWLVVTGAPTTHWKHAWDDDDTNDEQWPYEVSFWNTNIYGKANINITSIENVSKEEISINVTGNELDIDRISDDAVVSIYDISGRLVVSEKVQDSKFSKVMPQGIYIVNIKSGTQFTTNKIVIKD